MTQDTNMLIINLYLSSWQTIWSNYWKTQQTRGWQSLLLVRKIIPDFSAAWLQSVRPAGMPVCGWPRPQASPRTGEDKKMNILFKDWESVWKGAHQLHSPMVLLLWWRIAQLSSLALQMTGCLQAFHKGDRNLRLVGLSRAVVTAEGWCVIAPRYRAESVCMKLSDLNLVLEDLSAVVQKHRCIDSFLS